MATDFESIVAKVARANEHLAVFHDESGTYIKECRPDISLVLDFNSNEMRIRFAVGVEPPPRLGLIAGDCVHNARSALDNLICALVRIDTPTSECKGRAFPAFDDPHGYADKRAEVLKGVPANAQTLIDQLQPSSRTNLTAAGHPVRILNDLSNRDKHRAPHLTNAYSRNTEFKIHLPGGGEYVMVLSGPAYSGTETVISRIPNAVRLKAQYGMHMDARGFATVAFKDRTICDGQPVEDVLRSCLQFIEQEALPRFEPFFR